MEEEKKLKIVEMKKTQKEVNNALLWKVGNMTLAAAEAWGFCYNVKEFMDKGTLVSIPIALLMLNWFIGNLKRARENTNVINANLDKEIDLEEAVEKEGLTR